MRFNHPNTIRCDRNWLAKSTTLAPIGLLLLSLMVGCDAQTLVQGTIRDTSGKPISDAVVAIKINDDGREVQSIEDGRYLVHIWQAPIWKVVTLKVSKAGYVSVERKLKGPGVYTEVDIVLQPAQQSPANAPVPTPENHAIGSDR